VLVKGVPSIASAIASDVNGLLDVGVDDARICCSDPAESRALGLKRRLRPQWKGSDVMKQFIVWAMPVGDADDTEAGGSFRRTVELRRLIKIIARLEVIAGRLNRSPENFGRRQLD
jgi:hypothetical protein